VAYAIALGMTTAAAVSPAVRSGRSHSPRYCRSQAMLGMRPAYVKRKRDPCSNRSIVVRRETTISVEDEARLHGCSGP
jgi:hypothetical protein